MTAYAKRYGVDRYTAYDDHRARVRVAHLGAAVGQPPRGGPRRPGRAPHDPVDDPWRATLDGRLFFVVGYTSGGAPYGVFADEMPAEDDPF